MEVHVLNGATGRIQGRLENYTLNSTARINATGRIQGMASDEMIEFYLSKAMGDRSMNGTLQGMQGKLRDRIKARKAKRQEKKLTKAARKEEKRALRDRRRLARTEALERGEGFFQKAAGALTSFADASKIRAQAEQMAAEDGISLDIPQNEVLDFAGAAMDTFKDAEAPEPTFFEKYKTPLAIGAGVVVVGTALYFATRKKKTAKR